MIPRDLCGSETLGTEKLVPQSTFTPDANKSTRPKRNINTSCDAVVCTPFLQLREFNFFNKFEMSERRSATPATRIDMATFAFESDFGFVNDFIYMMWFAQHGQGCKT
jgi:hypothetical protein